MDDWIDIGIIHKISGVLVICFILFNAIDHMYSIYADLLFGAQTDYLTLGVLSMGLILEGAGGIGVLQSKNATFKRYAFGALYTVSAFKLLLYVASAILVRKPQICATVVTDSGGDPVRLTLGVLCFLFLLGIFHWTNMRV